MKLSKNTLGFLKNFGSINQGIFIKPGKTIKTISSLKNILVEATIEEDFDSEFAIYDLNSFLSALSLDRVETPLIEFEEKNIVIISNKGRSRVHYRFCDSSLINTPPEKGLVMPDAEVSFTLLAEDFDWVLRSSSVLSSPMIAIESDGDKINFVTLDLQNDSAHSDSLELPIKGNGNKFRMNFKTEVISKLLPGNYDVQISSKGVSQFKHKDLPIKYWVTTEPGSNFEKLP
jgi:hypothetical protein